MDNHLVPDSFIDVAIIGAGAAGIAAARHLKAHNVDIGLLEARDRIGGRAHTLNYRNQLPLDLGAGWLHSANHNPLVPLAAQLNFSIDKTLPPWDRTKRSPPLQPERAKFAEALKALEERLEAAAKIGIDRPASDFLLADCPWNPLLDAFSTFYNGAEFDQISILDYAAYEDTEVNWRVREGYGNLIAALGRALPVLLETPVTCVDITGRLISVETPRGIIHAKVVIVAVPTSLLADERIRFRPNLPDKAEAAANLPLGLADKVFLGLETPEALPANEQMFGRLDRTEICAYHLRPFGRPYIEAYCGGRHARALESIGKDGMIAFATEELVGLLGSEIRKNLTPLAATTWGSEPFSCGSYSHALPGHVEDRKRLAESVDSRLFFAGEACSVSHFSTVHGAYESGIAAAEAVLARLRPDHKV